MRKFFGPFACLAALATVPQPLAAQEAGHAMTLESGGTQPGCIGWERSISASPDQFAPERVLVMISLHNECGRAIYTSFQSQTGCCHDQIGMASYRLLQPGQVLNTPDAAPYAMFDPPTDRYLNFWLIQSDGRFSKTQRVDLTGCYPHRDRRTPAPPCPPTFRL